MIGKTISHYKILEKIGSGGMGVVYKAEDTKLQRTVALKFLPPNLTFNTEEKKRFVHEAIAAASLDHSNICAIYEIDETKDGQMFIAMAYYEGETLKDKIASGPLPLAETINIAIQVAEGLTQAHKKDIIHRDIKSANVIVTDNGTVKILDFGLAKLRGVTKLTKEGTTLGTTANMSPEQASGENVDNRSDIWSQGVILYEMITGRLPFNGDYEQAIMYSIMNEEPEPVTGLRSGVPMELERIVNKTLAKNPEERYQHADDLMVDLQNIKTQTSGAGTKVKKRIQKKKKEPLNKTIIFILPILLVVIFIGYFALKKDLKHQVSDIQETSDTLEVNKPKWKNSIAVLPFSNISADKEQEYFCDGMTEDIITKLTHIRDLKVISRTSVMNYKKTKKSIKDIGRELAVDNILEGSVRKEKNRIRITAQLIRVTDDAHLWARNYDRQLESIFEVQDEVSKAIANSLQVTLSPRVLDQFKSGATQNILAYEYFLKGMYIFNSRYYLNMNDKNFYAIVEIFKKALEIDPNYARAYGGLSWAYGNHYIIKRDIKYFNQSLKFAKKARELAPDSSEGYKGGIGYSYTMMGKYDMAYIEFKKALQKSPNSAILNFTTGFYYHRMGLYHQALKYCTRANELDPLLLLPYATIARSSLYLRNYSQSAQYLKKAFDLFPDQSYLIRLYCTLYLMTKNYDKAEECIDKLEKGKVSFKSTTKEQKAILYAARGEKKKALALGAQSSLVYSLLGMKDKVVAIIQKSLKESDSEYPYLYLINNPHYDNLRDDLRFQKIVADAKEVYEERLKKYGDL